MRRIALPALLASLLAACSGEPAAVEFDRPVGTVYSAFSGIDGKVDLQGLLKSPGVTRTRPSDKELVFLLGSDSTANRGQIAFRFEPLDGNRSRVLIDAELPEIAAKIDGVGKMLSESSVERELQKRVAALAKRMNTGGLPVAEIEALDQAIAFTAIALDPKEVNRALAMSKDMGMLTDALEREAEWNGDSASEWDEPSLAMDDAGGDIAMGEEPEPDADWGAASE